MKRIVSLVGIFLLLTSVAFADISYEKATTNAVVAGTTWSWTPTINGELKVNSVGVKFRKPATETVTITLDSGQGASHDVVVNATQIASIGKGVTLDYSDSYFWQPSHDFILERGDTLNVQITGDGRSMWFGVLIKGELK